MSEKPSVAIYTGNHTQFGVNDQIQSLYDILSPSLDLRLVNKIDSSVPNILIENFDAFNVRIIRKLASQYGIRFYVLLTEHMQLDPSHTLYLNNQKWNERREYIPNLYERFLSLVGISDLISGFVLLYGYPNKLEVSSVFPNMNIYDLCSKDPYAVNVPIERLEYDFCFIGAPTQYREYVINSLRKKFRVFSGTGLDEAERASIIASSIYSLNVPQNPDWHQISPMRIIASARSGRYTLSITDNPPSHFPYLIEASLDKILSKRIDEINSLNICDLHSGGSKDDSHNEDLEQFIATFHAS